EDTASDAKSTAPKSETRSAPSAEKSAGQPASSAVSSDALSPAARRVVTEEKLDPQEIRGSGKGGRVTKADALSAAQSRQAAAEAPAPKAVESRAEEKPAGAPGTE